LHRASPALSEDKTLGQRLEAVKHRRLNFSSSAGAQQTGIERAEADRTRKELA
jgi:hypothetical protein